MADVRVTYASAADDRARQLCSLYVRSLCCHVVISVWVECGTLGSEERARCRTSAELVAWVIPAYTLSKRQVLVV